MATNAQRLAGVAYIAVDGRNYMLSGDLSYMPSTVQRTSLIGQDGVHGYSEMPITGYISGTLRDSGKLTVADINAMTGVTVTIEMANGKTVIGRNMWTTDVQEVKTQDATFDVKWEGPSVEELTTA